MTEKRHVKRRDSPLQAALRFLSHHVAEWIAYMGLRAVMTLAAVLVISLMLVLGRMGSSGWFFFMLLIPPLAYGCARPALRRREWRLVSLFLYDTAKSFPRQNGLFQPWWPAALDVLAKDSKTPFSPGKRHRIVRNWQMKRVGVELLTLLPFVVVGVALVWRAPWPLIIYVIMTAIAVGWGFAAGGLVPVFVLMLVERIFPEAFRNDSITE